MKSFEFLNENLAEDCLESVDLIFESKGEYFDDFVLEANLNPLQDFRHSDLSGIDFSHAVLTRYDFTGADLRGAYGTNVIFPPAKFLQGADVDGSIFAYVKLIDAIASNVPNPFPATVIDANDPIEASSWIISKTSDTSPDQNRAMLAALTYFETGSNPTILSDTIYSAKRYFRKKEDYFSFLTGAIASKKCNSGAVIAALKMLVAGFPSRTYTKNVLISFLRSDNRPEVQAQSVQGLGRITLNGRERDDINEFLLSSKMANLRKYMLSKLANSNSGRFGFLVRKRSVKSKSKASDSYKDIFDPITEITIADLTWFYDHQLNQAVLRGVDVGRKSDSIIKIGGRLLHHSILIVLFDEMRAAHSATGLTFKFNDEIAEVIGQKSMP